MAGPLCAPHLVHNIVPTHRPYMLPLMRIHLQLDNIIYRLCETWAAFIVTICFVRMRLVEFFKHSVLTCLYPSEAGTCISPLSSSGTILVHKSRNDNAPHTHFHAFLFALKLWFENVQTPEINIMFSFLQMQTYNHLCKIKPRTDVYLPALIAACYLIRIHPFHGGKNITECKSIFPKNIL